MNISEIIKKPAYELAKLYQEKKLTCHDITLELVKRTNQLNPLLKCFVSFDEDYVLHQAQTIDSKAQLGKLAGVPIGIKDIMNTYVLPTQMGSPIWAGHKAGNDARCVTYLRREDAIVWAKTDTAEFAVHEPGLVRNPHDITRTTGTSSGGSAAAVASAMVPAATGTQTAGSLIRPASWCGIYGMKPSFGLVPRTGVLKTTDTLDNIGFYGRAPEDLKILLDSMRIHGDNFPIVENAFKKQAQLEKSTWRIAFIKGFFWSELPQYAQEAMVAYAKKLSSVPGIEVVELELPREMETCHAVHRRIYNSCLAYYFRRELSSEPNKISESFKALARDGQGLDPLDYRLALAEQEKLAHIMEQFFKKHEIDFLISHASNGSAPVGGEPLVKNDLNLLWTLTWLPVINIPQFTCPEGMPYGMKIIGARYSDYRMFSFLEKLKQIALIPSVSKIATAYAQKKREVA